MPRNITVTFKDGTSHVYRNAPDDITPEAVQQRAMQEFGKPVTALDGGRKAAPAPKTDALRPNDAKTAWDRGSAALEKQIANLPEAAKKIARDRFFADPRIARLRERSAQPGNARFDIRRAQESANQRAEQNVSRSGNFLTALKSGITRGAFGLPERLAANLQSAFGETGGLSREEILEQVRANTDADLEQSLAGNIIGQVVSGGLIGGAAAKSLGALAAGTRVGNAARTVATAAPKTTKVASSIAAGAAGGGAQAVGEGSDVGTGTVVGAVAGPVGLGLGKLAGFVTRPVRDLLPLLGPKADEILRRFTKSTADDIRRAADEYRAQTGSEPTLFEVLPLEDRNAISKNIVGRSPATSEQAANAVRQRVSNVGPEMARTVENATGFERANQAANMFDDLGRARGGNEPIDGEMAARAVASPVDLEALRRAEASAIMGPVDEMPAADTLESLFPRGFRRNEETGEIAEVYTDPELNRLVSDAAGALRLRASPDDPAAAVAGLSVNDVMRVVDKLGDVSPAHPNFLTAQRAINHLLDSLPAEAGERAAQMREAFAARSRMMEGMEEGARTRTRESVPVDSRSAAQTVGNAYDTPEGAAGRFLGQSNVLGRDFAGTTSDVLRNAGRIAESGQTQAALRANLGGDIADEIIDAVGAQARGVRNLASVNKETGKEAETADLADVAKGLLGLSPSSMVNTKIAALTRMLSLTRFPEKKAKTLVDMLFSQNAATTNRAIAMLNSAGRDGRRFLADLGKTINLGARAGQVGQAINSDQGDMPAFIPEAGAADIEGEFVDPKADIQGEFVADENSDIPYGRQVIEEIFPEAVVTSDHRGPDNDIYDPNSGHAGFNTVDVRPIPGMTFDEFLEEIEAAGHEIVKAYDESQRPADPRKARAWGPHWHVEIA